MAAESASRSGLTARLVALVLALGGGGCSAETAPEPEPAAGAHLQTASVPAVSSAPEPPPAPERRGPTACEAPSRRIALPIDARHDDAVKQCERLRTGQEKAAGRCGEGPAPPPLDLDRLHASVLELGPETVDHIRQIRALGREQQRRADAFGLVGDSMTVSGVFLYPYAQGRRPFELAPEVAHALTLPGGASIIDFYRGVPLHPMQGVWKDSFGAHRAAKVGAQASWALRGGVGSPLDTMITLLSPAVAVVAYGGNEAASLAGPPSQVADAFAEPFERLVDALTAQGIVPILSTLARHGSAPGHEDCVGRERMSNWRIAVNTNAVSARVAEIACRRRLPLVDLRHALDGLDNHGLGPDGVHPSYHARGPGDLTARGLRCGYNVRNYLTLHMLARVKETLDGADAG